MDQLNDDDRIAGSGAGATALRYTESQVLFGLREVLRDATGEDAKFSAHDRIVDFAYDIDLLQARYSLENIFDISPADSEWKELFGLPASAGRPPEGCPKPTTTFGELARFIVARAPVIATFEPISIFGLPCESAGVFQGLSAVADRTRGDPAPFAPKAEIRSVLNDSALEKFWTRVYWMTEGAVPPFDGLWSNVGCYGVLGAFFAVLYGLILSCAFSNSLIFMPAALVAVALYAAATAYRRFVNPLPRGVRTFRDLSLAIVQARRTAPVAT